MSTRERCGVLSHTPALRLQLPPISPYKRGSLEHSKVFRTPCSVPRAVDEDVHVHAARPGTRARARTRTLYCTTVYCTLSCGKFSYTVHVSEKFLTRKFYTRKFLTRKFPKLRYMLLHTLIDIHSATAAQNYFCFSDFDTESGVCGGVELGSVSTPEECCFPTGRIVDDHGGGGSWWEIVY